MRAGLNAKEITQFHKMLRDEVPLEKIAKHFTVEVSTLKKLTPEAIEAAKKKQAEQQIIDDTKAKEEAAEVLAKAAEKAAKKTSKNTSTEATD